MVLPVSLPISPATVPHTPTGTHSMHTLSHSRAGTPRQSYARAHSHSRAQEHIVSPYVGGTLGLPDGLSAGDFPFVAIAAKSPRRRCSASPARRRATGRTRSRRPRFIRSVAARADSSAVAASLRTQVPKEASSSLTPTAVCHAHHQIRHGSTVAVQLFALSIPTQSCHALLFIANHRGGQCTVRALGGGGCVAASGGGHGWREGRWQRQ